MGLWTPLGPAERSGRGGGAPRRAARRPRRRRRRGARSRTSCRGRRRSSSRSPRRSRPRARRGRRPARPSRPRCRAGRAGRSWRRCRRSPWGTWCAASRCRTGRARQRHGRDAEPRPLDRQRPHHVLDGGPRGAGVDHPGHAHVRRDGDAHDLAAPLRDERLGRGRVGHLPGALDVELDHRAEALRRDRLRGAHELPAGIVHQQVEAAVALEHPVEERVHSPRRRGCRAARASALPPAPATSATISSSGSARRPQPMTVAPRRASSSAVARPIPVPAPETTQTRPSSRPGAKIRELGASAMAVSI